MKSYKIKVNHIAESTGAHQTVFDTAIYATTGNRAAIYANTINELTGGGSVRVYPKILGSYKLTAADVLVETLAAGTVGLGVAGIAGEDNGVGMTYSRWEYPAWWYGHAGSIRVKITINLGAGATIDCRIYKNGTEDVAYNTTGAKSRDISVNPGDVITIEAYHRNAGANGSAISSITINGQIAYGP